MNDQGKREVHTPINGSKHSYKHWLTTGLIVLLIAALIACIINIHTMDTSAKALTQQLSIQQSAVTSLTNAASNADAALAEQQSVLAEMESKLKEKESAISSYETKVSDLNSRLQQGKKPSSGKGASVSAYATVAVTNKTCYLTFDDGPSENTLEILKILDRYHVKATFFVIGSDHLSYVKQMKNAGHTVGLHSYSHNYSKIYASQKAYFDDLQKISDAVEDYIGEAPKVIRFPGGASNTVSKHYCKGIMSSLSTQTRKQGYVYFDWNVDSLDASGNNVAVTKMVNNIKKEGGHHKQDVVLMHDTDAKDTTVEALPAIIEFYIEKGYTFAPLTTSTPPVTHGINN